MKIFKTSNSAKLKVEHFIKSDISNRIYHVSRIHTISENTEQYYFHIFLCENHNKKI